MYISQVIQELKYCLDTFGDIQVGIDYFDTIQYGYF